MSEIETQALAEIGKLAINVRTAKMNYQIARHNGWENTTHCQRAWKPVREAEDTLDEAIQAWSESPTVR